MCRQRCRLALVVMVVSAGALAGCGPVSGTTGAGSGGGARASSLARAKGFGVRRTSVVVPANYLTAKAWQVPLLKPKEAESVLVAEVKLKEGIYGAEGLSLEIERVTGRRVIWVPRIDRGARHPGEARGPYLCVSSEPGRDSDKAAVVIPTPSRLQDALNEMTALATEMGFGPPCEEAGTWGSFGPEGYEVWCTLVTSEAILIVRLSIK